MGCKDIDLLHIAPYHEKNIEELWEISTINIGEVLDITPLSRNPTYKIDFASGITLKVKRRDSGDDVHKFLLRERVNGIPQIVKEIEIANGVSWRFTEWIEGKCFNEAINKREFYKKIDPDLYYKLGLFLGNLTNYAYNEYPVAMSDILWGNFVIDESGQIWAIDTLKISTYPLPERWIIDCIIYHQYSSMGQKKAFINGHIESLKTRKFFFDYLKLANDFIGEVYAKLEKQ